MEWVGQQRRCSRELGLESSLERQLGLPREQGRRQWPRALPALELKHLKRPTF